MTHVLTSGYFVCYKGVWNAYTSKLAESDKLEEMFPGRPTNPS
jgi:hypothetical protein